MTKTFYVTTAIDYVNAEPHIGHTYQKVLADVIARWNKVKGNDVLFLTGTDEFGQKVAQVANESGVSPQEFVDEKAEKFQQAWKALNIDYDIFMRTTEEFHKEKVQEFIKLMQEKGDIYKGEYSGLYCLGCEAYITEKDCVDGRCPYHPNQELKKLKEKAYFFKLSKYQDKLLELYEKNPKYILPLSRKKEFVNRVKQGLKDLNITREKFDWGVPFPLDEGFVTYVWYEALLNYITALDWPNEKFKKFWPANVQFLGIDNGWFHCVIWPAMLMSLGIEPSETIAINGFLTFNGQKISKSLGNAISPNALVEKYSADSIRYYVCRNFVFGQDGDFSEKELIERHNGELVNKLGNLVSRVAGLIEKNGAKNGTNELIKQLNEKKISELINNYEFDKALNEIFNFIDKCNEYVQDKKPWETKDSKVLGELRKSILKLSDFLLPFIPESAEKIKKQFSAEKIKKGDYLFTRIENN